MGLKSLNELNQEFQMEIDSKPGLKELEELAGIHPDTVKNPIIKPLAAETAALKPGVKSLYQLNREFQTEIDAKREESGFISPLIIKVEPPLPTKTANTVNNINTDTDFIKNFNGFPEKNTFMDFQFPNKKSGYNKQRGVFAVVSDMLFYIAILTVLFAIVTSNPQDGAPRMVMGYSYFTVLTSSMQKEIPKGSFILVHKTDSQKLNIGDNITFMRDASTTVTHKIIDIYENYENSGARGFQTKGVNNTDPDSDIVYEANVVGKVILVIPGAGAAIIYLRANIYIVFIIFGLCIALSFLLRVLFAKPMRLSGKFSKTKTRQFNQI